jgi:hypothetical protein
MSVAHDGIQPPATGQIQRRFTLKGVKSLSFPQEAPMRTAIVCLCLLGFAMVTKGQDRPIFIEKSQDKDAPVFIENENTPAIPIQQSPWTALPQTLPTRWEYTRLEGILVPGPNGIGHRSIYRACRAATSDWHCRDFASEPTVSPDLTLREALFTLGQDGWELVAAVPAPAYAQSSLSYLFKRPHP